MTRRRGAGSTVSVLMVFIVLGAFFSVVLNAPEVWANGTIYIRADGSIDPPAAPISTVDNITYAFIDNINGSIVVERDNIVVDGAGLTLQGPGNETGIDLSGSSSVTIKNMEIKGFEFGIYLIQSFNSSISGNNITNNNYGVYLFLSSKNVFMNNIFTGNRYSFGVSGYRLSDFIQDMDATNTVDGKRVYYWVNRHNIEVPPDGGFVALVNSTSITVRGLELKNNYQGIVIAYTTDSKIGNNSITNNLIGVHLINSSHNSLFGNSVTNNDHGVYLYWSSINNALSRNNITNNNRQGLEVTDSSNNTILGNNITNSRYGVGLWGTSSSNNTIRGNSITNNDYGVYLDFPSNNTVFENSMQNNWYGVVLDQSPNNKFYHNDFVNNIQHVYIRMPGDVSFWDYGYPSSGNYWHDYGGQDEYSGPYQNLTGSDGIGDSPYVLDANNQDHFPLMGPFNTFVAGTWNEVTYGVDVVSNSTVSGFSFSQADKMISFNVTGANGYTGFCRVTIPHSLLGGPYLVLVNDEPPLTLSETTSGTHTFLYFTYTHSARQVEIIGTTAVPEFPPSLILPLFLTLTSLAPFLAKRILKRRGRHA